MMHFAWDIVRKAGQAYLASKLISVNGHNTAT